MYYYHITEFITYYYYKLGEKKKVLFLNRIEK